MILDALRDGEHSVGDPTEELGRIVRFDQKRIDSALALQAN